MAEIQLIPTVPDSSGSQLPIVAGLPAKPADSTTAGNAAMSNSTESYTAATRISNTEDLRTKAPKLWNAMLQGIATHICGEMKHHADRLKDIMRKSRE